MSNLPDDIAKAIWGRLGGIIALAGVAVLATQLIVDYGRYGFDSTDNLASGERSHMEIRTDCLTGLQYLSDGGLTPRMGLDGKQMREACK